MDVLAFDGRMGASGDMLLGALLAAGADPDALTPVAAALDVEYGVGETTRNGITATDVTVRVGSDGHDRAQGHDGEPDRGDGGRGNGGDHGHDHDHGDGRDRDHEHSHDDGHEHSHDDDGHDGEHHDDYGGERDHSGEGSGPTRTYREVVELVESMGLPAGIEADALAVFERLGAAEAAVHGTDFEATTFHAVGADDAVADVVGTALLIDDLAPDRVVTTPLATGGGEVATGHGTYPVPAPAVVELARDADWEIRGGPVEAELLTPTGAAILAHHAEGVDAVPALRVRASGYGAGDRSFDRRPNVLRAIRGESRSMGREGIAVLETNLDDATPETLGGLQATLADAGALDVTVLPATMKKSRPGHLVKVVARPEDAERVARRLAAETGTLGVRQAGAGHRFVADRHVETVRIGVSGESYDVDVKVGAAGGERFDVSAEFDDALEVARETGLAVREVVRRAETAYHEGVDE